MAASREPGPPHRDLVVIGASAGGLAPLLRISERLPVDFPACVLVVVHTGASGPGLLPMLLGRHGPLAARPAQDGDALRPGLILVARPDHHLLVDGMRVCTPRGPRENGFRPAIDPLFRSAAVSAGRRVIGVVLSGALDDGTVGLQCIKARGGIAVVQEPSDATMPSMPRSAMQHVDVDHVVKASDLGPLLDRLVREPLQVSDAHGGTVRL